MTPWVAAVWLGELGFSRPALTLHPGQAPPSRQRRKQAGRQAGHCHGKGPGTSFKNGGLGPRALGILFWQ